MVKVFITCSHLNALASLSTVYLIERQQIRNISPLWHFGLQTNSSVSVCSLCEGSKDIKNLNTFLHLFRFFSVFAFALLVWKNDSALVPSHHTATCDVHHPYNPTGGRLASVVWWTQAVAHVATSQRELMHCMAAASPSQHLW